MPCKRKWPEGYEPPPCHTCICSCIKPPKKPKKKKKKKKKPPKEIVPVAEFEVLNEYNWNWKRTPQRNAPVTNYKIFADDPDEYELRFEGEISVQSMVELNKDITCFKYTEDYRLIAIGDTEGRIHLFTTITPEHDEQGRLCSFRMDIPQYLKTLVDFPIQTDIPAMTSMTHRPVTTYYPTNESLLCTYTNGWVKCWNYKTGECMYTMKEKREIFGVKYHPMYKKILTYGSDGKVFLYDEETKVLERELIKSDNSDVIDGHKQAVCSACFNPQQSNELITAGLDDVLLYWDLRQRFAQRYIPNLHVCAEGIDINSRGTDIVTASWQEENSLQIWDYKTAELKSTLQPDVYKSKLFFGKFIPNKDYIVCGGSHPNVIRFVDLQTQKSTALMHGLISDVTSIDFGRKKLREVDPSKKTKNDISTLPRMIFASGRELYQIDFFAF